MNVVPLKKPSKRTPEGNALKLAIGTAILKDGDLTPVQRIVAWFIADYWNEAKGISYPPIDHIAATLHLSARAVRYAITGNPKRGQLGLNDTRYFVVEKKGRNYTYRFKVKTPAQCATDNTGTLRHKHRHIATQTPAQCATHPSNPIKTYAPNSNADANQCGDHRWKSIKEELAKRLTPDVAVVWFDQVAIEVMTEQELVLAAPSRFSKQYIENHFGRPLLDCVQALHPSIEVVRVVTVSARAAE